MPEHILLLSSLLVFTGIDNDCSADNDRRANPLDLLTQASNGLLAIKVATDQSGKSVGENDPSRLVWNENVPTALRVSHFAEIRVKEPPNFHDDEFGGTFATAVKSPGLQVGVRWRLNGSDGSVFELRANYHPLPIKANVGFPQWRVFGLFGQNFVTSDWWGKIPEIADARKVSQKRPNQMLTKIQQKDTDTLRFFSLPLELSRETNDKFFADNAQRVRQVHSVYTDGSLKQIYLIRCQRIQTDKSIRISHCKVRSANNASPPDSEWELESEWKSELARAGSIHTIGSLGFQVSEIVLPRHQPSVGWIHIRVPDENGAR